MLKLFTILSLIIAILPLHAQEPLNTQIDNLIQQKLPHATLGILVKDAQTGQLIYSKNPEKLLAPASNIKLFTAAAALIQLTPDQQFTTTLAKKDNNYYLQFNGSPSLTKDNLIDLILTLKKNNIKQINANIILDTTRFKAPYYANGISYDDLGWYYTAPDTALMIDENTENFTVQSAAKAGLPVIIKAKSSNNNLKLINKVITVEKSTQPNQCTINIEIHPNNTLRLYGCMVINTAPKELQLAIPNPILMAKQIIHQTLMQNDIKLNGQIIKGTMPADAQRIISYHSHPITKLVQHMLQESDNLYANSLTKQLGFALTKIGSNQQGALAIKKILKEHTRLDMQQIELTDGMGTRYNLVTPQQIVLLLTHLYQDKQLRPLIMNALPQAGISGTLKDRLKKTKLEQIVYAKTGTMHDISSLSGYIVNPKGRTLVFAIVINGINRPITIAKNLEEQILLTIMNGIPESTENAFG